MYPYVDDPVFIAPLYAQTDLAGDKLEDVIETKYGRVLYKVIIRKDLPFSYTEEEKFVYQLTMKILDDTQVNMELIDRLNNSWKYLKLVDFEREISENRFRAEKSSKPNTLY